MAIDPGDAEAHRGLGQVLDELGLGRQAWAHHEAAYRGRSLRPLPYRGQGRPVTVLTPVSVLGGNIPTREQQKELARLVMKDLGLGPNDIQSLQKMEWSKLFAAGNAAAAKINPAGAPTGPGGPGKPRAGWSPSVDGKVINMRSFFDAAPEVSKHVPMLIGSVSEEGNQMSSRPTEQEWHASLAKTYGEEKASAIVAVLRKAYPAKQIQTLSYICSGRPGLNGLSMRNNVVKMAALKHDLHAAPAYAYYFTWQTPMLDGLPGAWHTAELQFCFDNIKRCEQGTGNTGEAQILAKKMASSWAAFAANGNPSIGVVDATSPSRACSTRASGPT